MNYRVLIPKSVHKQITRLPLIVHDSVVSRRLSLQSNPRPIGSLKLHGSDGWRIRFRDYRIIYDITDVQRFVVIRRVGHRREIYR